jgi:putative NADPH-quinone reductase
MTSAAQKILIVNGHPEATRRGLCHALSDAYAKGAREQGREVRYLEIGAMNFGFLGSQSDFEKGQAPAAIAEAQRDILWAEHLVVVFPLWLGDLPALLKAFFEQTLRPGFAFTNRPNGFPISHLKGRSARAIVTMGMPALVYRWYFLAHGLKNLERNILRFCGFRPVRSTILGSVGTCGPEVIKRRLAEVEALGRSGD